MVETIVVSDCRKLIVKVFVIGYREKGESIVIIFLDKESVIYSMAIDSYKIKDCDFITSKVLDAYHVQHINLLCWTHPDIDHSVGIDELFLKYCDKNSEVYIPTYMNGIETDPIKYNKDDLQIIQKMFSINDKKHKCIKPVSVNSGTVCSMKKFVISDGLHEIKVNMEIYAPHTDYLVENVRNHTLVKKNDLSMFLLLQIGPYKFNFTGDVENKAISNMSNSPFEYPLFLKIPHHSSLSSGKMLDRVKIKSHSMSCTTTYFSQGLPNAAMLEEYNKKYIHLHSTGISKNDSEKYGMLEYVFDLFGSLTVHIKKHGNACKIDDLSFVRGQTSVSSDNSANNNLNETQANIGNQ